MQPPISTHTCTYDFMYVSGFLEHLLKALKGANIDRFSAYTCTFTHTMTHTYGGTPADTRNDSYI